MFRFSVVWVALSFVGQEKLPHDNYIAGIKNTRNISRVLSKTDCDGSK
jgi:hypothetical protein